MSRSILILNARRRVFLVEKMREYVSKKKLDLKIITSDTNLLDPIRFFSDDFVLLPPANDECFLRELKKCINEKNVIGLMIWYDSDLNYIDELREEISKLGVKLLMPNHTVIDICHDKRRTYEFFKDRGVLTPQIHTFEEFSYFDNISFPLFIKPYDGAGSMWCYKIENRKILEELYYKIPNPIVQDYIEGVMYTVDAFCDYDGEPLCIIPRVRLKVRDSEALVSKIDLDKKIINLSNEILNYLCIVGPVNLQFIKNTVGDIYLIEINPRISGGLDLSMAANAPFHSWIIQYFLDDKFEDMGTIINNLVMTRYYSSVFFEEK